ncbi:hypothetical protein BN2475_940005 [Paraburkholderia ribeironis]|uniref:Uncharacterized protein n=1 Tax=Paraburkholderia ribeironis TaxID=1247936 RepID=A0A1N7SL52_9BURK|nr:hypothetical protein BN2475_940005 [Paraburkholderia ribeironis]
MLVRFSLQQHDSDLSNYSYGKGAQWTMGPDQIPGAREPSTGPDTTGSPVPHLSMESTYSDQMADPLGLARVVLIISAV